MIASPDRPDPDPEPLALWVVYQRPEDWADRIVARRWSVHGARYWPTDEVVVGTAIGPVRQRLMQRGLVNIGRAAGDDPTILEVWV